MQDRRRRPWLLFFFVQTQITQVVNRAARVRVRYIFNEVNEIRKILLCPLRTQLPQNKLQSLLW